jgi:hypothetical protein
MGFVPSADTVYAVAYLTEIGRSYLFNDNNNRFDAGGDDLFEITKFTLSDIDTNYNLPDAYYLSSGEVPDLTGESEDCLKTTSNYVQSSLLAYVYDSTPTNIEYGVNSDEPTFQDESGGNPPVLVINEGDIPSESGGGGGGGVGNNPGPVIGIDPGLAGPAISAPALGG